GRLRIPDDGAEVDVAGRDDAAGAGDAAHLAEGADRVGDVLEDLVGVDDVERAVGEVQGVDVGDGELDVVQARGVRAGLVEDGLGGVGGDDPAGGHALGEPRGDRSRAAAHVEDRHPRAQVPGEVGGGVVDRAPPVGAEHARVVTVGVGR